MPPKPYTISLPDAHVQFLDREAKKKGMNRSEYVRSLIRAKMDEKKGGK